MYDTSNLHFLIHTPSIQSDTPFCPVSVEMLPSWGRILDYIFAYTGYYRVEKLDPVPTATPELVSTFQIKVLNIKDLRKYNMNIKKIFEFFNVNTDLPSLII